MATRLKNIDQKAVENHVNGAVGHLIMIRCSVY